MPKEKVYDAVELFDVEVGWSSSHDVQLGISTHDGRSLAHWLAGQQEGIGSHRVEENDRHGYTTVAPDDLPQFTSIWASLDRTGINRLITMLRKARDEAYGRDA